MSQAPEISARRLDVIEILLEAGELRQQRALDSLTGRLRVVEAVVIRLADVETALAARLDKIEGARP